MWFIVVCTLIDNVTRNHSGQNVVDSRGASLSVHTTLNHIRFVKQTTINQVSICLLPQYQCQRKCFFSERELKKVLRDTLRRAAWYGLLLKTAN